MADYPNIVAPFSHLPGNQNSNRAAISPCSEAASEDRSASSPTTASRESSAGSARSGVSAKKKGPGRKGRSHADSERPKSSSSSSSGASQQSFSSPIPRSPSPTPVVVPQPLPTKSVVPRMLATLRHRSSARLLDSAHDERRSRSDSRASNDQETNVREERQTPAQSRRSSVIQPMDNRRSSSFVGGVGSERRSSICIGTDKRTSSISSTPDKKWQPNRRTSAIDSALSTMRLHSGHRRSSSISTNPRTGAEKDAYDYSDYYEVSVFGDLDDLEDNPIPVIRMLLIGDSRFTVDMAKYLEGYNKLLYEKFGAGLVQFEVTFCTKASDAIGIIEKDEKGIDIVVCEFTFELLVQPDFSTFLRFVQEEHEVPLLMTSLSGLFSKKNEKARNKARVGLSQYVTSSVFPLFHGAWLTEMENKLQKAADYITKQNREKMSLRWKLMLLDSEKKKNIALQSKLRELSSQGNIPGLKQIVNDIGKVKEEAVLSSEETLSPSTRAIIGGLQHTPRTVNYLKHVSSDYRALQLASRTSDLSPSSQTVPATIILEHSKDWASILSHTRSILTSETIRQKEHSSPEFDFVTTAHEMACADLFLLSYIDSPWNKENIAHSRLILASLWRAACKENIHQPIFSEPTSSHQKSYLAVARDWISRHFSKLRNNQMIPEVTLPQGLVQNTKNDVIQVLDSEELEADVASDNLVSRSIEDKNWEQDILGADISQLPDVATSAISMLGFFDDKQSIRLERNKMKEFFQKKLTFNDSMVEESPHLYIIQNASSKKSGPDKPFLLRTVVNSILNLVHILHECHFQQKLHLESIDVLALVLSASSHRLVHGESEKITMKDSKGDYKFSVNRSLYMEVSHSVDLLRRKKYLKLGDKEEMGLFAKIIESASALDPKQYWEVIGELHSLIMLKQHFAVEQCDERKTIIRAVLLLSQWWYVTSNDPSIWGNMVQDFVEREGDIERNMGLTPPDYMDRMHWINVGPSYHLFVANNIVGPILDSLRQLMLIYGSAVDTLDEIIHTTRRNSKRWAHQILQAPYMRDEDVLDMCIPAEISSLKDLPNDSKNPSTRKEAVNTKKPENHLDADKPSHKKEEPTTTIPKPTPPRNHQTTSSTPRKLRIEVDKPVNITPHKHALSQADEGETGIEQGSNNTEQDKISTLLPPLSHRQHGDEQDVQPITVVGLIHNLKRQLRENGEAAEKTRLISPRKAYTHHYPHPAPDLLVSPTKAATAPTPQAKRAEYQNWSFS